MRERGREGKELKILANENMDRFRKDYREVTE